MVLVLHGSMRNNMLRELITPAKFQEMKNRNPYWVLPDSDMVEAAFETAKIQRVLDWVAAQICTWCYDGVARRHATQDRRYKYEHLITRQFVEERGWGSYDWIPEDGETWACLASDFIDGPTPDSTWETKVVTNE
jgi:hypothetical protein